MACRISLEDYASNVEVAVAALRQRYRTVFGAKPTEVFLMGSLGASLLRLAKGSPVTKTPPMVSPGPHPRMRQLRLGAEKVVVPAGGEEAMHLEAAGCMLYTDQDSEVGRRLFKQTLSVYDLE